MLRARMCEDNYMPTHLQQHVTPDMEYLTEMRLTLELGRLQAQGLQPRAKNAKRVVKSSDDEWRTGWGGHRKASSMFISNIGYNPLLTRAQEVRIMRMAKRWVELQAVATALKEANHTCVDQHEIDMTTDMDHDEQEELRTQENATSGASPSPSPPSSPSSTSSPPPTPELAAWAAAANVPDVLMLEQELWCGQEARFLMAQYNVRLVVHIASKHVGRGLDMADLIAEGLDGLMRAVDKFDASKGFKFSTYAHWWVRQAMTRAITNQSRIVRLPVHVWDMAFKIQRAQDTIRSRKIQKLEYSHRNQEEVEVTPEEVAEMLGISAERVVQVQKVANPILSLDSPVYKDNKPKGMNEPESLVDTIAVPFEDPTVKGAKDEIIKEDINALLSILPSRERNIIRMRYGLAREDGSVMTFGDIGQAYGLTRERIRQIEEKALRKLQRPESRRVLRAHLYSAAGYTEE